MKQSRTLCHLLLIAATPFPAPPLADSLSLRASTHFVQAVGFHPLSACMPSFRHSLRVATSVASSADDHLVLSGFTGVLTVVLAM